MSNNKLKLFKLTKIQFTLFELISQFDYAKRSSQCNRFSFLKLLINNSK